MSSVSEVYSDPTRETDMTLKLLEDMTGLHLRPRRMTASKDCQRKALFMLAKDGTFKNK